EFENYNFEFNQMICKGIGHEPYILRMLPTCFKARFFPHLHCSADVINRALVESDWIEKFRYNDNLGRYILKRVITLQEKAPSYYSRVVHNKYREVFIKLHKEHLLSQFGQEEVRLINTFF